MGDWPTPSIQPIHKPPPLSEPGVVSMSRDTYNLFPKLSPTETRGIASPTELFILFKLTRYRTLALLTSDNIQRARPATLETMSYIESVVRNLVFINHFISCVWLFSGSLVPYTQSSRQLSVSVFITITRFLDGCSAQDELHYPKEMYLCVWGQVTAGSPGWKPCRNTYEGYSIEKIWKAIRLQDRSVEGNICTGSAQGTLRDWSLVIHISLLG